MGQLWCAYQTAGDSWDIDFAEPVGDFDCRHSGEEFDGVRLDALAICSPVRPARVSCRKSRTKQASLGGGPAQRDDAGQ